MTAKMTKLLERLIEMFPNQDYQSRLESYIRSKGCANAADVEHWIREYDRNQLNEKIF